MSISKFISRKETTFIIFSCSCYRTILFSFGVIFLSYFSHNDLPTCHTQEFGSYCSYLARNNFSYLQMAIPSLHPLLAFFLVTAGSEHWDFTLGYFLSPFLIFILIKGLDKSLNCLSQSEICDYLDSASQSPETMCLHVWSLVVYIF